MFNQHKNSYLQLVVAMNPRVINKAVDRALHKRKFDTASECMAPLRLDTALPSLFAPHVDITRTRLGYGRIGLRLINRDLHSPDQLVQLQAVHTVLDQVQIAENALFLINLQLVYRLIDLMQHRDPVIREKVCMILTHLATYHQGRQRIMTRLIIIKYLMLLIMRDRKEIRFAAAITLNTLSQHRCACEFILKEENLIENLLKMIKNDHIAIVLMHLKTFENLADWDPVTPLKLNAFQIMLALFEDPEPKIVWHALNCMTQLCKHDVGKLLADEHDLTMVLMNYIHHKDAEVILSAVNLMCHTTITTRSKWRAKERAVDFTKQLVILVCHNKPTLQLRCLQVLINLCDCPDIRYHMKHHWEPRIKLLKIRTHEEWDGTSDTTTYGLETGHNYRTMCIEAVETIKNDYGDNPLVNPHIINVHSYLRRVREKKEELLAAINWKSYK